MPTFNNWHTSTHGYTDRLWPALRNIEIWNPALQYISKSGLVYTHGQEKWSVWCVSVCVSFMDQSCSLGCYRMVRTDHQVLLVPNNAVAQIIVPPFYSQPHPLSERESVCDSSSYCITTRGNDTKPDNFHHHGWEQLGFSDKRSIALKIRTMISRITAGLIIAVRVRVEEVQASNNSSWFTSNLALCKSKYRDLRMTAMAQLQEIYIRNPLAVLNVHLCAMQAPRLLKAVLLWIPWRLVQPIWVLGTWRWMALCQRSLSHYPTVLLSLYPGYNDTVKAATSYVGLVMHWTKAVINKHVHCHCTNLLLKCTPSLSLLSIHYSPSLPCGASLSFTWQTY